MSEFNYNLEGAAARMIDERVERTRRARMVDQRPRHSGRRRLATGLHNLANRLDA